MMFVNIRENGYSYRHKTFSIHDNGFEIMRFYSPGGSTLQLLCPASLVQIIYEESQTALTYIV